MAPAARASRVRVRGDAQAGGPGGPDAEERGAAPNPDATPPPEPHGSGGTSS